MTGDPPQHAGRLCPRGWGLLLVGLVFLGYAPHSLADTTARFVEMLRAEGHGDLVIDYLERAEDDPLVSAAFRKRVPYERLATLYDQAKGIDDTAARQAALEALASDARSLARTDEDAQRLLTDLTDRLATGAADLARNAALAAKWHPVESERAERLSDARSKITRAQSQLDEAERLVSQEHSSLRGVQPGSPAGRRRADLGTRLGLVRLLRVRLLHELAETYPPNDAQRDRLNRDAAGQFASLYEKYSKWGVGLYAHLYEGRCYRLLGQKALAIAALEDLTAQPAPTEELRRIVTLAHAELAALHFDEGDIGAVLEKPAEWFAGLDSDERSSQEAAVLQYRLALAAIERAGSARGAQQRRQLRDARDWLAASARIPSEVQADARDRWAEVSASLGVETQSYETFDEALAAAAEAIQAMLAFDMALGSADGDRRSQLSEQRRQSYDAAYQALEAAVRLADSDTDPEQDARARYQLAWLDWDRGDAATASVRAEHVARNSAETDAGQQAARLTLAAYEKLQRAGDEQASNRLPEVARFVLDTWPDSDVSAAASSVLVGVALRSGDLAAANEVLETVPAKSRPAIELRLAVARWERSKGNPDQAADALQNLQRAHDAVSGDDRGSAISVTASLYLAEAALAAGDVNRAKSLIDNPRSGVAAKVRNGEPPADSPTFALAALKAMIRVEALEGRDPNALLNSFSEQLAASDPEKSGGDRAWLGLGVALLSDLADAEGAAQDALAQTLSTTLGKLSAVERTGDWNTRLWVAQAWLRCGETLRDGEGKQACLAAGRDSFAALVEQSSSRVGFAPSPRALLAARLRLAECAQQLGDHEEAVASLTEVLTEAPVLLEAQRVAAQSLQDWGAKSESVERLEQAIAGAHPGDDGKNVIWGWSKLAAVAGRFAGSDPSRRQLYFDAWRNVARSRYEAALITTGEQRASNLRKASSTLAAVRRKNPDLGGADNQQRYDELKRAIDAAGGGTDG